MRFAVGLGAVNHHLWAAVTEESDQLGLESVWMPEHLVVPIESAGSPFAGSDHPPGPPAGVTRRGHPPRGQPMVPFE
jgi:hypothetical protein